MLRWMKFELGICLYIQSLLFFWRLGFCGRCIVDVIAFDKEYPSYEPLFHSKHPVLGLQPPTDRVVLIQVGYEGTHRDS
jgi:hypothetical protein